MGMKSNRSDLCNDFLKHHSCDTLYLVGDIIDFWELSNKFRWSYSDSLLVRQIVNKQRHGSKIYYITGNHDEVLREMLDVVFIEGITICNEIAHETVDGKKLLVIHGDLFDSGYHIWSVLSKVGNRAYDITITLNRYFNNLRAMFGLKPWSVALYLKQNVKSAANYINKFEEHMIEYCKIGGYSGAICGHIHKADIRKMGNDLVYMNCGDWVESLTAIVENEDGTFEIVHWNEIKDKKNGEE
jgi:UDP-2,3-diacylglucosamine pyrophosphatase LpxH